jgi:hypothetical protein
MGIIGKIRSTKHEIRSNLEARKLQTSSVLDLSHFCLFRISDFDIRVWG